MVSMGVVFFVMTNGQVVCVMIVNAGSVIGMIRMNIWSMVVVILRRSVGVRIINGNRKLFE
jgi:hypothetical protein